MSRQQRLLTPRKNASKFLGRNYFQLRKRALGGLLVAPPSPELRHIPKTVALQVIIGNLGKQLRPQWLPREIQAYIHAIYGQPFRLPAASLPATTGLLRDVAALLFAALLASAAVFAKRLPRKLRLASRLGSRLSEFRQLQSGHPGDYVVWTMVGFVFVGGRLYFLS